jgi:hypothetical protein
VVSKLATHKNYDIVLVYMLHNKKNHDDEHGIRCCGFKACNTKKNTRTTSCVHHPSFTSNAMNVAHCLSFTSCGKKTMIMRATFIVMVLELVKQKNQDNACCPGLTSYIIRKP